MRPFFLFALLLSFSWVTRGQDLAVVGAKVYASPTVAPVDNATIVIRAGKIVAVGKHVSVPTGVKILQCTDCVVFAGFWNTHVHFMEAKWMGASSQPADKLGA
jgi:cytosine/adenosine deaminase-related metal-dependent hydrolase